MTTADETPSAGFWTQSRLELVAVSLMSITAVLTAWTAFQSSKWGGEMAIAFSEANAARTLSVEASNESSAQRQIDVGLFAGWVEAYAREDQRVADFYMERFPAHLAVAVDAWLALRPLQTADAPPSPFAMEEYETPTTARAADLVDRSDERSDYAREANARSDSYVLLSVMLAGVLFLAGVSSKVINTTNRTMLLGLAVLVLIGGVITLTMLPVQL